MMGFTTSKKAVILVLLVAVLVSVRSEMQDYEVPKLQAASSVVQNGSYVSAFFILGDSSVDCGENTLFYPFLHQNLSLVPCDGSDSSLLPHLLAEKMGLPDLPLFYHQNGSIEAIRSGMNYGSAQATILNPDSPSHQSLNQQLRQVLETLQLLSLQLDPVNAQKYVESSIFYLSFGKDDYINFLGNVSTILDDYTNQAFAHVLVNQVIHAIRTLYDVNVRKIVCMGILPLGCTPRILSNWYNPSSFHDATGCVGVINELVLQYNTMLEIRIEDLNAELSDAQIVFCDVYQGIMEIIMRAAHYGFNDARNACCGLGPLGASIGCLSPEMGCSQSSGHVWWDLYNPTKAVNSLLADSAWFGHSLSGICRRVTVQELVYDSFLHQK